MSFTSLLLAPNIIRLVWHHVYGSHSSIATKTTLMVLMLGVGCKTVVTLALDIGITHMCKNVPLASWQLAAVVPGAILPHPLALL